MKTKEDILKSQLLHDNLPFSNKTFEKEYSYALEAMEEYTQERTKDMFEREFIMWIVSMESPVAICYGSETPFATHDNDYTLDELYQYYLTNVKGK